MLQRDVSSLIGSHPATLCRVIEKGAPEYLYQQLAGLIRERIRAGELPPRSAVPSITELAAEHDLATLTVRRAMRVLVDEGWIITMPGRGTFVADKPPIGG